MQKHDMTYDILSPTHSFSLRYARCTEDSAMLWARTNYNIYTFEYILRGNGIFKIGGQTIMAKQGDCVILPKGYDHAMQAADGSSWMKLFINCSGLLIENLLDAYGFHGVFYFPKCGVAAEDIFRQAIQIFETGDASLADAEGALLIHKLIQLFARENTFPAHQIRPIVLRLLAEIEGNYSTRLDIGEMARKFFVTPNYLQRAFKEDIGISPYHYHLNQRLRMAQDLLAQRQLSIGEISTQLSFPDPYHFSKIFKKHIGKSPRNFQKELLQEQAFIKESFSKS